MQNAIRHSVQNMAVMADQQKGAGVTAQMIFKPHRRFEIEMVGRLVEEEEIRLGEQSGRQGDTHAPAAGEILSRFVLRRLANSETSQNRRRARRRRLSANIVQAGLDFRDAVRVFSCLGLGEEGVALGMRSKNRFQRRHHASWRLLRDACHLSATCQR